MVYANQAIRTDRDCIIAVFTVFGKTQKKTKEDEGGGWLFLSFFLAYR